MMIYLFNIFHYIYNESYAMKNIIKENLRIGILLTEVTSEEAWKKFYSSVEKFPTLNGDIEIYNAIEDLYPMKNGQHNRGYFMWIYRLFSKGLLKREDFYKVRQYLRLFDKFINKIPKENRDINSYSSIQDLYVIVKDFEENEDTTAVSNKAEIKKIKQDEIDRVYEDGDWLVMIPRTERASCLIGKGTQWCTAATEADNYFEHYSSDGPLYYIVNRDSNEKYQLHFESDQLMDVNDRAVSAVDFFNHIAEGDSNLLEFFRGASEKFNEFVIETSLDDVVAHGDYSEIFYDAISGILEEDPNSSLISKALNRLRDSDDEYNIYNGFMYEEDPTEIKDYQVINLIDTDGEDTAKVLKHLKEIDYDFSEIGLDNYTEVMNGLAAAKLELGGEYTLDNGKVLKLIRFDFNNRENAIIASLDGQKGNIGLDAVKSMIFNRNLFERIIRK